ncbi:MAG: hypothetical protein P1V34_13825 [Alphaproteobacteria bacterium]|nr:hypothetical protein [Alphaproteobacteria bacterium]
MVAKKSTARRPRNPKTRRPQSNTMRQRLMKKLPDMLDAAIAAYQQIALNGPSEDPKSFAAAHTGAKAALAHIEQIIKLAEAAAAQDEAHQNDAEGFSTLITAARSALEQDEEEQEADQGVASTLRSEDTA